MKTLNMRMTMLTAFNTIQRSKHFKSIEINKKVEVETVYDKDTGLRYFVIKDVLQNPDEFVELMQQHPAYGGDVEVLTPGYRQLISSLELPSLTKLYGQLFKEFTEVDTKLSSWYYTGNIYHKDMVTKNQNNLPRFEPYPIGTILSLTKDTNVGVGFFKAKVGEEHHVRYNETVKDCDDETFKNLFPSFSGKGDAESTPWKNFDGNDNWKPYAFEHLQYNSVVVFDPLFFHQIYFDEDTIDSPQYTLTGYLDTPIVEIPFWKHEKELDKKDEPEYNKTNLVGIFD
jgi:hypothetical protein